MVFIIIYVLPLLKYYKICLYFSHIKDFVLIIYQHQKYNTINISERLWNTELKILYCLFAFILFPKTFGIQIMMEKWQVTPLLSNWKFYSMLKKTEQSQNNSSKIRCWWVLDTTKGKRRQKLKKAPSQK